MTGFNLLLNICNLLNGEDFIRKSLAGIFINNVPEKTRNAFIILELLSLKGNITKKYFSEIKLSICNSGYIKNLEQIVSKIDDVIFKKVHVLNNSGKKIGSFAVRDVNKKVSNSNVIFLLSFIIKLD